MVKELCTVKGCNTVAEVKGRCFRHASTADKRACGRLCEAECGCDKVKQIGKHCWEHAPEAEKEKELCNVEGCNTHSEINGRCYRHASTADKRACGRLCEAKCGCDKVKVVGKHCWGHATKTEKESSSKKCKVKTCYKTRQLGQHCHGHATKEEKESRVRNKCTVKVKELCNVEGCNTHSEINGRCYRHALTSDKRACGRLCEAECGCDKAKQVGNHCWEHANAAEKEKLLCKTEGCNKCVTVWSCQLCFGCARKESPKEWRSARDKINASLDRRPAARLIMRSRTRLHGVIASLGLVKSESTRNLLGVEAICQFVGFILQQMDDNGWSCDMLKRKEDLREYLEIDHIVSIRQCFDDFRALGYDDTQILYIAFHWSNHQPLIAQDNRDKSDQTVTYRMWSKSQNRWVYNEEGRAMGLRDYDLPSIEDGRVLQEASVSANISMNDFETPIGDDSWGDVEESIESKKSELEGNFKSKEEALEFLQWRRKEEEKKKRALALLAASEKRKAKRARFDRKQKELSELRLSALWLGR